MTEFQYKITEDDYVKCMKLAASSSKKQLLQLSIGGIVCLLLGIFGPKGLSSIGYAALIAGVLGYFFALNIFTPYNAKKSYRKYKAIQSPMTISFSDEGYNIKAENGQSNAKWGLLLKWRENNDFILVYLAPRLFNLIPKRLAEAGFDVDGFRKLLQAKLGASK